MGPGEMDDGVGEDGGVGVGAGGVGEVVVGGRWVVVADGGGGGEMSAGGEAEDGGLAVGVDPQFGAACAEEPDGALCVVEHGRVVVSGPEAVEEDGGVDAGVVEALSDGLAFVEGVDAVGAAGADDEAGPGLVVEGVEREGGRVFGVGVMGGDGALVERRDGWCGGVASGPEGDGEGCCRGASRHVGMITVGGVGSGGFVGVLAV